MSGVEHTLMYCICSSSVMHSRSHFGSPSRERGRERRRKRESVSERERGEEEGERGEGEEADQFHLVGWLLPACSNFPLRQLLSRTSFSTSAVEKAFRCRWLLSKNQPVMTPFSFGSLVQKFEPSFSPSQLHDWKRETFGLMTEEKKL